MSFTAARGICFAREHFVADAPIMREASGRRSIVQKRNVKVRECRLLPSSDTLPRRFALWELHEPFTNAATFKLAKVPPFSQKTSWTQRAYLEGTSLAKGRVPEIWASGRHPRESSFAMCALEQALSSCGTLRREKTTVYVARSWRVRRLLSMRRQKWRRRQ